MGLCAVPDGRCALSPSTPLTSTPPAPRPLLPAQEVLKVGVGSHGDAMKLRRDHGLELGGVVCLSDLANQRRLPAAAAVCATAAAAAAASTCAAALGGAGGNNDAEQPAQQQQAQQLQQLGQKWSLAGLVGRLLGLRLEKGQRVRCGDWERLHLSPEQRHYAATDAWASLRVYEVCGHGWGEEPALTACAWQCCCVELLAGRHATEVRCAPVCARLQVLCELPVLDPAAAVPAASAQQQHIQQQGGAALVEAAAPVEGGAASGGGWACVPALPSPRRLQPAKLAVYQLVEQQGMAIAGVAVQRGIQRDSVEGYLAEAIIAGWAYSWGRLGVSDSALHHVAAVCGELLGRTLATEYGSSRSSSRSSSKGGGECEWGVEADCGASGVGDKRPALCSPHALLAEATAPPPESEKVAATPGAGRHGGDAAAAGEAPLEPVDVLSAVLAAGPHRLVELKEQRFADVSYGHLRLAAAHLGRCNLGPWGDR